ncbi:response regulator [Spirosoma endophyticum]|uniref:Response regulator receiver domain-containing protein n=1 Tax=Spirosoma endophyticum TaxID=662367 RepID=A0A1I1MX66_9BACT|nr:response regulator [Spirosoma endophyticum]SFC87848.1 Response regulator receiver domain-containing protein [Spirosoma endophyticum]
MTNWLLQDLYLPDRADGLGLLADIHQLLSGHQQIPTLVMSSSAAPADVQQAYRAHTSYYLVKPLELSQWLNLCRSQYQFLRDQDVLPIYPVPGRPSS